MAWAQNLLGFCLFACASQARFSWVLSGGLRAFKPYVVQRFALLEATFFLCFYLYLVGSKSNVSAFFRLQFRNGLRTKLAGVLLFRMRVPSTFFMGFVWWLAGFQVLRCAKVCLAWGNLFSLFLVGSKTTFRHFSGCGFAWLGHYFFVFSGFQKRRFGIFPAAVSQWLGHKTCWGSAFSHARPKHVFHGFCLVACGLSSLTLRKGLPCLRQPFFSLFLNLYLVGSKSNVSAFFWLRFRMAWAPFSWVWPGGLQASKSYVAQRFALRFRMAWARFVIVVERWGIWRWRPSMGLLPLCAPVGTASPKAPRACFSWKLPATVTKLNYIKFKVYRQWDSHIRVASSCTIWKAADSTTFGCLVFLGWHDWPSVCCWLVGIDPLGWASTQKGWSIPETCLPSPKHCFDRPHPTLLSPLLGVGGMGGSPSIWMKKVDSVDSLHTTLLILQSNTTPPNLTLSLNTNGWRVGYFLIDTWPYREAHEQRQSNPGQSLIESLLAWHEHRPNYCVSAAVSGDD